MGEAPGAAAAILLAAGNGTRLSAGVPKALVEVGGRPLITWAVEAVEACAPISGFVVTVPPTARDDVARHAVTPKLLGVVDGGDTRQESVALALAALPAGVGRVVCHDVARPFAPAELFGVVLEALGAFDGAVPVVPSVDTLKRVAAGLVAETVSRDEVFVAQTPQAFRRDALAEAHRRAVADGVEATDDAALLERLGLRVAAVAGDPANFKVTLAPDLHRARAIANHD